MNTILSHFTDIHAAAKTVASMYPESAHAIIRKADEIADRIFIFDSRWDLERTTEPFHFRGKIDYLKEISPDCEALYAFNRNDYWITLGQAYALTDEQKYLDAFVSQCNEWIDTVKKDDAKAAKAWRTLEAGFRLSAWSKAYTYFSADLTSSFKDKFHLAIEEMATFLIESTCTPYYRMSNWGIIINHGLFVSSMLSEQGDKRLIWHNHALAELEKELRVQVYDDGVHWEQSAMYHNEVLRDALEVMILLQHGGYPVPEWLQEKVHAMALFSATFQRPDGTEEPFGDSDVIDQKDLMCIAAAMTQDTTIKSHCPADIDPDAIWYLDEKERRQYAQLKPKCASILTLFPAGGRAYYQREETYLSFKAGTLGAGHGHGDQLHIDIAKGMDNFLTDRGRYTYLAGAERNRFKVTSAHNTLTINGKNDYEGEDSWKYRRTGLALGLKTKEKEGMVYMEASSLGYLETDGFLITRKLIIPSPSIIIVSDEIRGKGECEVTRRFHFSHETPVKELSPLHYRSEGMHGHTLYLNLIGDESACLTPYEESRHYNEKVTSTCIQSRMKVKGYATELAIIELDEERKVSILPVSSAITGDTISPSAVSAIGIGDLVVAITHYDWASPTDAFCIDGHIGWGRSVVFSPNGPENGTTLAT